MSDKQKKMAAALAAVCAYLQEEQASALPAPLAATSAAGGSGVVLQSLWGQYGRQEMMNMRQLVQLRAFSRLR